MTKRNQKPQEQTSNEVLVAATNRTAEQQQAQLIAAIFGKKE